jgi:hypothetical protein
MEPEIVLKSRAPNVPPVSTDHDCGGPLCCWAMTPPDSDARCLIRKQLADTKRTHQKRHARRLATHLRRQDRGDLHEKRCCE